MKRSRLSRKGKSPSAKLKEQIQAKLRERVIERDGGCILRNYPEAGQCGWTRSDGEIILQAEHLNGRANSVSYAELDNIVCLCIQHHYHFKKQNSGLYWILIQRHLGEERWKKVQAWMLDRTTHPMGRYEWEEALKKL